MTPTPRAAYALLVIALVALLVPAAVSLALVAIVVIATTVDGRRIAPQLVDSATSVSSNYRASCKARSRAEFAAKIGFAHPAGATARPLTMVGASR